MHLDVAYNLHLYIDCFYLDVGCLSVCLSVWPAGCRLQSQPWLFAQHLCRASDAAWDFTVSSTLANRLAHKSCSPTAPVSFKFFEWLLQSFSCSSTTCVYHVHPTLPAQAMKDGAHVLKYPRSDHFCNIVEGFASLVSHIGVLFSAWKPSLSLYIPRPPAFLSQVQWQSSSEKHTKMGWVIFWAQDTAHSSGGTHQCFPNISFRLSNWKIQTAFPRSLQTSICWDAPHPTSPFGFTLLSPT